MGPFRGVTRFLAAVLLIVLAGASPASARPDDDAVLSPLGMEIDNPPRAVLGADGRNHLAYEITIVNQSSSEVMIGRVQPRARGKAFGPPLEGARLESLLRVNGGGGPPIPAGGSALLFMDVTYARRATRPQRLTHGFDLTLSAPGKPDQQVRQGQVLGLLGNTGNTDGPHLHFHIMDGPSPLQSNGLPFVYSRFSGRGLITDQAALLGGQVTPIDDEVLAGEFRARMPLGNQVVDFGR